MTHSKLRVRRAVNDEWAYRGCARACYGGEILRVACSCLSRITLFGEASAAVFSPHPPGCHFAGPTTCGSRAETVIRGPHVEGRANTISHRSLALAGGAACQSFRSRRVSRRAPSSLFHSPFPFALPSIPQPPPTALFPLQLLPSAPFLSFNQHVRRRPPVFLRAPRPDQEGRD